MDKLPLISVIVPVYKVEQYLDCCVRSILSQTYPNLEVILVDDGSPDNSGSLCDAWAAADSRVKVLHTPNGGAGKARNAALELAGGELIAFADSDDYLCPDMYGRLYRLMTDTDSDIAECGYMSVTQDDVPFPPEGEPVERAFTPSDAMREHIADRIFQQIIWNKLYRAEVVRGIRFPEGRLIDDEFWTYQVLGRARRLARCDAVLYAYRQQSQSAMHKPWSLGRLHGLDAKQVRLEYLRQHFPELAVTAESDLLFSCLMSMQGCLRYLRGEDRKIGRERIHAIADPLKRIPADPDSPRKRRLLLEAAQQSLEGTARVLNLMNDLHILE